MFGIGGFELFIILIFGFLIFGPEKLPEIAKTVGKGIAHFRQAQNEMNEVIKSTDIYDPNSDEPFKDPMEALDKVAKHQEEKKRSQQSASNQKNASTAKTAGEKSTADGADEPSDAAPARQESFTERKARYERERAARKAAEQKAAEEKAAEEAAAKTTKPENGEGAVEQKAAGESTGKASVKSEPSAAEPSCEPAKEAPAVKEAPAADEPSAPAGEGGE